jgi:hypothetical protein
MKALPFSSYLSVVLCSALATTPLYAQAPVPGAVNLSAAPEALQLRVVDLETLQSKSQAGAKQAFNVEVTDSAGAPVPNAAVTCRLPDTGATGTFADGTHATVAYTDASGRATLEPVQWGPTTGDVPLRLTATKGTVHTAILVETALAEASPASHASASAASTPGESATEITPPANASEASPSTPPTITQPVVSVTKPPAKSAQEPGQVTVRVSVLNPAPDKLSPSMEPSVSVSRTSSADAPHGSHAKWYVLALVGVAAGAGAAMAMRGHSSSTTTSTSAASVAIGTPTVSIGH